MPKTCDEKLVRRLRDLAASLRAESKLIAVLADAARQRGETDNAAYHTGRRAGLYRAIKKIENILQ